MSTAVSISRDPRPAFLDGDAPATDPARVRDRQLSFEAALGKKTSPRVPSAPEEVAKDTAEQLVTQCFILPLLKQLRETNHSAPPFAPTQAERQFGALGDAQLAQRITRASHFPLVDRLARDLLKRAGLGDGSAANELQAAPPPTVPGVAPALSLERSSRT